MDVEKETLNSRRLMVARDDSGYQLATALQDEPAASETRLIFLQYRSLESINPICIDLIGLHCELDPDFFTIHFESDFDHTGQELAHYPAHSLPSERRFLQIRTDEWTFMTATWKMSEKKRTYYLFPYVREAARQGASICAYLTPFREGRNPSQDFHLATKWETNQRNRRAMITSLDSLSKFLANSEINPQPSSLQLDALLADYRELIRESEMIAADLQVLLQQQSNLANIDQAKRAAEQTDSVRK
ncbi:hypothetical protein K4F52_002161 [Lecanicillium sp. MT-2017a]|nr:hypothetical protein K4F52_002161 [Lecanicillium sp. MT-2017a]